MLMKKFFIFAISLAAGAMAFISCSKKDNNDPSDTTTTLDPAELLSTSWRTESVYVDGEQSPAPHFYLQILSNPTKAVINSDTVSYSITGNTLTCDRGTFKITDYTGTTAKITGGTLEINLTKMPEWGEQFMDPKTEDFVGTWKLAYYTMDSYSTDPSSAGWHTLGTNPGVETWELRADGTAIYHSTFTGETENGSWSFENGMQMVNNPAQSHMQSDDDRITVQPLTTNWMGFVRGIGSGSTTTYYQWYFVRVK